MTTRIASLDDRQSLNGTSPIELEAQELAEVLQKIVQNAGALLAVNNCSVALLDEPGTSLVTLAALQKEGRKPRYTRFEKGEGVAGWVAEHREALVINDVNRDPRFKRLGRVPVGSMACVPLIDKGNFIGTLTVSSPEINAFEARELHMLTVFADQAVLAITNVELLRRVRADQEQLRAIVRESSDGIAMVDTDARFIEVNPAFGRIFGIDPAQAAGLSCLEVFGSNDEESQELSMLRRALQEQRPLPSIEVDLSIKGAPRSVGLSITPVSVTHRPFCVVIARDMTAIRDVARMKAHFLSMITHELRSPINAINGYLDLALTDIAGELNDQQREFIERARAGSEHLYALVEDLLLVSRADSGQLRLNRDVISLHEVIASAVEELELTARDNVITVNIAIAGDIPPIYADPVRLQQVLRNLLSNALHFTPSGGRVTIAARIINSARGKQATTGSTGEDQRLVEVQVSDTGCGIAPEHQQRIFERFYQIPLANSGRSSGQGLGLAIVKMIVELHGGQVSVTSVPGKGSTFSFTLPCLLSS